MRELKYPLTSDLTCRVCGKRTVQPRLGRVRKQNIDNLLIYNREACSLSCLINVFDSLDILVDDLQQDLADRGAP